MVYLWLITEKYSELLLFCIWLAILKYSVMLPYFWKCNWKVWTKHFMLDTQITLSLTLFFPLSTKITETLVFWFSMNTNFPFRFTIIFSVWDLKISDKKIKQKLYWCNLMHFHCEPKHKLKTEDWCWNIRYIRHKASPFGLVSIPFVHSGTHNSEMLSRNIFSSIIHTTY